MLSGPQFGEAGGTLSCERGVGKEDLGQPESEGAALRSLPPYSPEFNPIEKCRAQVKQQLRYLKAHSAAAPPKGLSTLSPQNAANYHCGCDT